MPKRTVSVRLQYNNHRLYRLRTRREIKAYINAMIANGKTKRKGTRKILSGIRQHRRYWADPTHCMAVYFMPRQSLARTVLEMEEDDDCARDERFALQA